MGSLLMYIALVSSGNLSASREIEYDVLPFKLFSYAIFKNSENCS